MHPLASSLSTAEKDLLRETSEDRMRGLDEDALVELHSRVRRARNKYVGIYRRVGSAKVAAKGGRGLAKQKNSRNAARAEVFEDALARVSARLAQAAAVQAEELKAARLAATSRPRTWPGSQTPVALTAGAKPKARARDRKPKGMGSTKRNAASKAQGKVRQAKKDAR